VSSAVLQVDLAVSHAQAHLPWAVARRGTACMPAGGSSHTPVAGGIRSAAGRTEVLRGVLRIAGHQDPEGDVGQTCDPGRTNDVMMRRRTTSGFHSYLRATPAATPAIHLPFRGRVSPRCANQARAPATEESRGSASMYVLADMVSFRGGAYHDR
jgi:hypothetical protein